MKSVKITPARWAALNDVMTSTDWSEWRAANKQRWGSAGNAVGAICGQSQQEGCDRLEELLTEQESS